MSTEPACLPYTDPEVGGTIVSVLTSGLLIVARSDRTSLLRFSAKSSIGKEFAEESNSQQCLNLPTIIHQNFFMYCA